MAHVTERQVRAKAGVTDHPPELVQLTLAIRTMTPSFASRFDIFLSNDLRIMARHGRQRRTMGGGVSSNILV